jgi:hypothetical protein
VAIAFQYCFRNVSRTVQGNKEQLKFDGAQHLVLYVDLWVKNLDTVNKRGNFVSPW